MSRPKTGVKDINASSPGLFHLSLNASQCPPRQKLLNRISVLEKLSRDFKDSGDFTTNAIQNLLGAFYYYNGKATDAIKCFERVKGSKNKNALANLSFVYQRLHLTSKCNVYQNKLHDLEGNTDLDAIFMAEQAFAMLFDVHDERDIIERNTPPYRLFEESIKILKEEVLARYEIMFWFSETCYKLYKAGFRKSSEVDLQNFYNKGVEYLVQILRDGVITKKVCFREGAWAYLGIFMQSSPNVTWNADTCHQNQLDRKVNIPDVVNKNNIGQYYENPKLCFLCFTKETLNSADSIRDAEYDSLEFETTEICIRFAMLLKEEKQFDMAENYLCKSEKIDSSEGNWFTFTTLAKLNLDRFKSLKSVTPIASRVCRSDFPETTSKMQEIKTDTSINNSQTETSNTSDVTDKSTETPEKYLLQYLDRAKELYDKALKMNPTPLDLSNMAHVHELLAKHTPNLTEERKESFILSASDYYNQAVASLGSERRPEVHRAQGRFLRDINEEKQAIECFKRAMEVDTDNKRTQSFNHLFETLIVMFEKQGKTQLSENSTNKAADTSFLQQDDLSRKLDKVEEEVGVEAESATHKTHKEVREDSLQNLESDTEKRHLNMDCQPTAFEETKPTSSEKVFKEDNGSDKGKYEANEDVENDGPSSSESYTELSEIDPEYIRSLSTDSKGNATILYEITYWLEFALKKYGNINLQKYVENHPVEFGVIVSFFKNMKKEHTVNEHPVSEYILKHLPPALKETIHYRKFINIVERPHPFISSAKKEKVCDLCRVKTVTRQNSVLPPAQESARHPGYQFDFFVIFTSKEKEWVYYSLLKRLEGSYGYKGAFEERDFRIGRQATNEPYYFLTNSFKVLVVLSDDFDAKAKYHLDLAQTEQMSKPSKRENFIIPILRSDKGLLPQLNPMVCLNAVIDINWERLLKALEMR